jgi:NADPH:quinone reductase-like Zn-dependent oxidoreductase
MEFAGTIAEAGAACASSSSVTRCSASRTSARTPSSSACARARGSRTSRPESASKRPPPFATARASPPAAMRKAELSPGRSIVVSGASGSIGTAAVQLAKHRGANVTAVCDTKSIELVRSLGADTVVDCTGEVFTSSGTAYDVIFDAVGKHAFRRCRRSLRAGGLYLETDLGFLWHVPILALSTAGSATNASHCPSPVPRRTTFFSSRTSSRRGTTAP